MSGSGEKRGDDTGDPGALHPQQVETARRLAASAIALLPADLGPADEPAHVFVVSAMAASQGNGDE
jgi:hypothetical protein